MALSRKSPFMLTATVDFPDDVRDGPYTHALLDELMSLLRGIGVRRINWLYYGDNEPDSYWAGYIFPVMPYGPETLGNIGEPLRAGVAAAHRHGLEIYGVLKPYNAGAPITKPQGLAGSPPGAIQRIGGPLVSVIPFIEQNPHARVRRRPVDGPEGLDGIPIRRIKLRKSDDLPTRISRDNIQVWVSPDNYRYTRSQGDFTLSESVERAPRDVAGLLRHACRVEGVAGADADPGRAGPAGRIRAGDDRPEGRQARLQEYGGWDDRGVRAGAGAAAHHGGDAERHLGPQPGLPHPRAGVRLRLGDAADIPGRGQFDRQGGAVLELAAQPRRSRVRAGQERVPGGHARRVAAGCPQAMVGVGRQDTELGRGRPRHPGVGPRQPDRRAARVRPRRAGGRGVPPHLRQRPGRQRGGAGWHRPDTRTPLSDFIARRAGGPVGRAGASRRTCTRRRFDRTRATAS